MYIMTLRPRTRIPSRPLLGYDRLVSRAKVIENQVMAAPFISVSSDLLDESVGSSIPVFELDTNSSSEVDPSESSLPHVSVAPMVSPFLCLDDLNSDTEIPKRHVSSTPHDAMLARWRSRVASRSLPPTTSTLKIPIAPIPPAPSAIDIPIGRLYHTHPGGPCRGLTVRKSVTLLSSHHLALRYTSHHLDRFTSGSSSDHSSSYHSSSGHSNLDHSSSRHSTSEHSSYEHSTSGHSLSGHTLPVTTIFDSSAIGIY
ncbi:hypothetical protein Tco_1022909 [Tanacetum coccineum]